MAKFGKRSLDNLNECHPDLIEIVNEAIKIMDFSVLCGHRNKEDQDKAFKEKRSKLKYPQSKHNKTPAMAVDLAPFPIDWGDIKRFERLCGIIEGIAYMKGIKVRMGRDFSFKDYPHVELI